MRCEPSETLIWKVRWRRRRRRDLSFGDTADEVTWTKHRVTEQRAGPLDDIGGTNRHVMTSRANHACCAQRVLIYDALPQGLSLGDRHVPDRPASTGSYLTFNWKASAASPQRPTENRFAGNSQSSYFARPMNSISGFDDCNKVTAAILRSVKGTQRPFNFLGIYIFIITFLLVLKMSSRPLYHPSSPASSLLLPAP